MYENFNSLNSALLISSHNQSNICRYVYNILTTLSIKYHFKQRISYHFVTTFLSITNLKRSSISRKVIRFSSPVDIYSIPFFFYCVNSTILDLSIYRVCRFNEQLLNNVPLTRQIYRIQFYHMQTKLNISLSTYFK